MNPLAITAFFTGLVGVITAVGAAMKMRADARAEGEQECEDRLAAARAETEQYARELHAERVQRELGP